MASRWIILLVLLTAGCFSPVSVRLSPRFDAQRSNVGEGKTVLLEVSDGREDRALGRRQHGLLPGSRLDLDRPAEETIRQSLTAALRRKSFTVVTGGNADSRLSVELLELRYDPSGAIGTRFTTSARLRATATSTRGTYSHTYSQSDEDRELIGSGGHFNAARLSGVLADTMRQMIVDSAMIGILAETRDAPLAEPPTELWPAGIAIEPDGRFGPSEWDDAARTRLPLGITLLTKRFADQMLVGVMLPPGQLRYVDLYVADAAGRRINLHASQQQGERMLPEGNAWTAREPPYIWGRSTVWRTNIVERTDAPEDAPFEQQVRPYQGFELAIPYAHLGRGPWRMRIEISDFLGRTADVDWPEGSTRHDVATWQIVDPPAPRTSH